MKIKQGLSVAGIVLALIAGGASAREFTSADGTKKMSGTVTAVSLKDKTATIRRSDGNSVKFPLAALKESDREYLADWYKASQIGRKLGVQVSENEEKGAERKTSNAKLYTIASQYDLELRNNATFTFEDVEVRYRLFFTRDKAKGKSEDCVKDGTVKLDELAPRGIRSLATESVSLNVQKPLPASQCKGGT